MIYQLIDHRNLGSWKLSILDGVEGSNRYPKNMNWCASEEFGALDADSWKSEVGDPGSICHHQGRTAPRMDNSNLGQEIAALEMAHSWKYPMLIVRTRWKADRENCESMPINHVNQFIRMIEEIKNFTWRCWRSSSWIFCDKLYTCKLLIIVLSAKIVAESLTVLWLSNAPWVSSKSTGI